MPTLRHHSFKAVPPSKLLLVEACHNLALVVQLGVVTLDSQFRAPRARSRTRHRTPVNVAVCSLAFLAAADLQAEDAVGCSAVVDLTLGRSASTRVVTAVTTRELVEVEQVVFCRRCLHLQLQRIG